MQQRDPVLRLLLIWVTLLSSVLVWLPIVRGLMNGETYQWSLVSGVGGTSTGGDYWMLLAALAYVLALQYSGRRGPLPLFPVLLLPVLAVFDAAVLYAAWNYPGALRFEGATFGIDVSLAYIMPIVFTFFVVLAVWWTIRRARRGGFAWVSMPWMWGNAIAFGLVVIIVPIQFDLFRHGGDTGNQYGVILTLIQWFILNVGLNAPVKRAAPGTDTAPMSFP